MKLVDHNEVRLMYSLFDYYIAKDILFPGYAHERSYRKYMFYNTTELLSMGKGKIMLYYHNNEYCEFDTVNSVFLINFDRPVTNKSAFVNTMSELRENIEFFNKKFTSLVNFKIYYDKNFINDMTVMLGFTVNEGWLNMVKTLLKMDMVYRDEGMLLESN